MPQCFIIMPITTPAQLLSLYGNDTEHFVHVLEHLITPAVRQIGYDAIQPIAAGADIIHAEVIKQLETADLVLCDISTLNPNVFFELGIRTAVDKPVAIIKDMLTDTVPFDTSIINYHTYDHKLVPWTLQSEIQALSNHIQQSVNRSENRNTLWKYFGLSSRAELKLVGTSLEAKVDLILAQMNALKSGRDMISVLGPTPSANKNDIVNWLITEAQRIARDEMDAPLELVSSSDEEIVFDLKNYGIGKSHVKKIKRLGLKHGVKIEIQRGHIGDY